MTPDYVHELIPKPIVEGMHRYVVFGIPTGSFLHAVLANDLYESVTRADARNTMFLGAIVRYVHAVAPPLSIGSPEAVEVWIKHRGLQASTDDVRNQWILEHAF